MKFPTNILSLFSHHAGTQDPRDAVLEVPRLLQPYICIPEPLVKVQQGVTTDLQTTSVQIGFDSTITNSSLDATVVGLAPGIWDVEINASFIADYTDLTERNFLYSFIEQTCNFATFWSIANIPQFQRFRFHMSHTFVGGFFISLQLTANAAGETKRCTGQVIANRLG